jgi:hypothetical protein
MRELPSSGLAESGKAGDGQHRLNALLGLPLFVMPENPI